MGVTRVFTIDTTGGNLRREGGWQAWTHGSHWLTAPRERRCPAPSAGTGHLCVVDGDDLSTAEVTDAETPPPGTTSGGVRLCGYCGPRISVTEKNDENVVSPAPVALRASEPESSWKPSIDT